MNLFRTLLVGTLFMVVTSAIIYWLFGQIPSLNIAAAVFIALYLGGVSGLAAGAVETFIENAIQLRMIRNRYFPPRY